MNGHFLRSCRKENESSYIHRRKDIERHLNYLISKQFTQLVIAYHLCMYSLQLGAVPLINGAPTAKVTYVAGE